MPIRFNPVCPCCSYMSIVAGVYCSRIECENDNPPYFYRTVLYFPPQKISLWKLGDGFGVDFESNEQKLDERSIDEELLYRFYLPGPIFSYLFLGPDDQNIDKDNIDENGNLKPNPATDVWAPLFLYADSGISSSAWYKIVFDLGKYGTVEKKFFVSSNGFIYNHLYSLSPFSFPKQLEPQEIKSIIDAGIISNTFIKDEYQDIKYTCFPPCIVHYPTDIEVKIKYSDIVFDYSFDICYNCYPNWWQYPYSQYYICDEEGFIVIEHTEFKMEAPSAITVKCKWKSGAWVSDPVDFSSWTLTTKIYNPDIEDFVEYIENADTQLIVSVGKFDEGNQFFKHCDSKGNPIYYTVRGSISYKNHEGEPLTGLPIVDPRYMYPCNVVNFNFGSSELKKYGGFSKAIINPTCEPLSGEFTNFFGPDDGITGSIKGG